MNVVAMVLGLAVGYLIVVFVDRRRRAHQWRIFYASLPGQTNPNYGLNGDWRQTLPMATHACKICGALWCLNPPSKYQANGSWSLASDKCGKCCDNVEMGDQIISLMRRS